MNINRKGFKKTAVIVALGMVLLPRATAQSTPSAQPSQGAPVSPADFQKLEQMVQQLNDKVQKLEDANTTQQQTHQADTEQIKQLQSKLDQTSQTASDAEQKSTAVAQAQAQPPVQGPLDEATVNRNFQILGDAEFQYAKSDNQNGTFLMADFAPIFLYRGGDNILFEAGFDFILQNNGGTPGTSTDSNGDTTVTNNSPGYTTTVNLSFAQLDYTMNDYVTLCAGNLLLPLGTYGLRSAGWLNKFPDTPLPVQALLPATGVGAELQGAIPLGNQGKFINYSIYGVNGPGSADGTGNASQLDIAGGNVGLTSNGIVANQHPDPSGGGRLGLFLPFKPHTDLELGISGQSGEWNNAGNQHWTAGVLDASLHLGSSTEIKGEYIRSWYGSDDLGQIKTAGWWLQASYKLAGLNFNLPVVNNTELVGRYDTVNDGFGTTTRRESVGFNYYFTNALLLEGDYEFLQTNNFNPGNNPSGNLIFQLSYGF